MKATAENFFIFLTLTLVILTLFYSKNWNENMSSKISCARFPQDEDIFIDNVIWQLLQTSQGLVKLFNAYLDKRWNKTIVKVFVNGPVHSNSSKNETIFCQFWFENNMNRVLVVAASQVKIVHAGSE